MKRRVVLWGVLALLLIGLAYSGPAGAQQPVVIKLGNVQEVGQTVQIGLKKFADLVAERTNNQIQVQIFPASQLGTEQEILEGSSSAPSTCSKGALAPSAGSCRSWRLSLPRTSGEMLITCSRRSAAPSVPAWLTAW